MTTPTTLIMPHSLSAIGLKYLLSRYFDIEATSVHNTDTLEQYDTSAKMLFFTVPEIFVAAQEFFIPRRSRTIIVTAARSSDMATIDPTASQSDIIDSLRDIIEAHHENKDIGHSPLSQREIDVLRLVAMGYINKEIADTLSISINTVLSHRKNITSKLGIRSVSGLGFYAMMHGYVTDADMRR